MSTRPSIAVCSVDVSRTGHRRMVADVAKGDLLATARAASRSQSPTASVSSS